jgi:hypothetical protein
MTNWSMLSTAALLVVALTLGGCSWIFMSKPPEPVVAPNYPVDCTASNAAPILDTICAGYFVANGIFLASYATCPGNYSTSSCIDSGTKTAGIIASASLAVLCGVSAGFGYGYASRCQQTKDLNALCITGDLAACQQLSPGWRPIWPPLQQGPPPPVPVPAVPPGPPPTTPPPPPPSQSDAPRVLPPPPPVGSPAGVAIRL